MDSWLHGVWAKGTRRIKTPYTLAELQIDSKRLMAGSPNERLDFPENGKVPNLLPYSSVVGINSHPMAHKQFGWEMRRHVWFASNAWLARWRSRNPNSPLVFGLRSFFHPIQFILASLFFCPHQKPLWALLIICILSLEEKANHLPQLWKYSLFLLEMRVKISNGECNCGLGQLYRQRDLFYSFL